MYGTVEHEMINYFQVLLEIDKQCEELRRRAISFFPGPTFLGVYPDLTTKIWYCYTPFYRQIFEPIKKLVEVCDIFGISYLEVNKNILLEHVSNLEDPDKTKRKSILNSLINEIKQVFSEVKIEAYELVSALDVDQKLRLNEALHCFLERCYYSSIVMSVSTVESKLLDLMKRARPEESATLDKLSLGQLLCEYLENETEYGNVIPKKYRPLLNLCNTYRVFSAHPKKEKINSRIATSILNLTFEFLLNKEAI